MATYYIKNAGLYLHHSDFRMVGGTGQAFESRSKTFAQEHCDKVNNYALLQNDIQKNRFDDLIGCVVEEGNQKIKTNE